MRLLGTKKKKGETSQYRDRGWGQKDTPECNGKSFLWWVTTQPPTGGLNLSPTSIPTYQQNIFSLSPPFGSLHLHIVDADVVPPNSQCSHYASFSDDIRIRLVILKITDLISAVLQQREYFSQLRRFNNRRGPLNFGVKKNNRNAQISDGKKYRNS